MEFGEWLCEEVLKAVPHRHFVFSIPKILRRYFLYDRKLLSELSRCGWETLKEFFREAVPEKGAVPGAVVANASTHWSLRSAAEQKSSGVIRYTSSINNPNLMTVTSLKCTGCIRRPSISRIGPASTHGSTYTKR